LLACYLVILLARLPPAEFRSLRTATAGVTGEISAEIYAVTEIPQTAAKKTQFSPGSISRPP